MILEIRHYTLYDGMLPAMLERFEEINRPLFRKHGIEVTDTWTHVNDENMFSFAMRFDDVDAREEAWKTYHEDPVFLKNKELQARIIQNIELHLLRPASQ